MIGHIPPIGVVAYDWLKPVAATFIIVHSLGLFINRKSERIGFLNPAIHNKIFILLLKNK
jgi:hypothetical protein